MFPSNRTKKILDNLFILSRDNDSFAAASIAAAIVYKNKVISYGFNQSKSHPFQNRFRKNPHSIFLHAEVDAIKNALRTLSNEDLSKCTLMVVRTKLDKPKGSHILGNAMPCIGCAACIEAFGIKKVIYSTDEGGYDFLK